ncbi:hypothetical protein [Metabacillus fastidiosus]|uniref:hypothetical protein n=1 Tax=Metabacillus fastidiosus TaxID=1458 RepID=UPI002E218FBA|nr:hypothetical protein [Metabacillus fastidiosus]
MSIQLKFDNDDLGKVYKEVYTDKMNYLVEVITKYKTGIDQFNVLNFEAGLGKSFTVNRVLQELITECWEDKQKFLIVKRFNDDSNKSVDFIHCDYIKDQAVAITHENWSKWQLNLEELQTMKVIFISHQRYIALCEHDELRELFSMDRNTLIIDEKINFPVYAYNDKKYSKIFEVIPNGLRDSLLKVTKPLNEFIELQKTLKQTNKVISRKFKIHPATLKNFVSDVEVALENFTIKEMDKRNVIKSFIKELQLFYSSQCLYNGGNISTYNPKHKHWGLNNNIILDASAQIDGAYLCNPEKYKIINQSRIIDHKGCHFNLVKFNSSKSNVIQYSEKYFYEIACKICENKGDNDNILVVGHKDFAKKIYGELIKLDVDEQEIWIDGNGDYNKQSIAISWYGNLIGKNWASDFTQVWLISTPNIPLEHYLIHFLHYSDDKIGNKSTEVYKGRYKNGYFNMIQKGYIASEIYQSLKRVQRVAVPEGDFFIACHDEEIIDMVLSQIKNVNKVNQIELDFVKQIKEEKRQKQKLDKKPDQVDKFIEFILNQPKGSYKKSEISDKLSITKINRILSDTRVKALLNTHLCIHNRNIERL